jgi:two-component system, NarL family, sensor histidine kinase DevS
MSEDSRGVAVDLACSDALWSAASLDSVLTLLADADAAPGGWDFHSRVCHAIARIAELDRVALLCEGSDGRVVGAWGIPRGRIDELQPTPDETARLRDATRHSPVLILGDGGDAPLPERYTHSFAARTVVCVPVFARQRLLGIVLADRGGCTFELSPDERHGLWLAGKLAALVLTARDGTSREQRLLRMKDWIEVGRRIHERVVQRLAGVAMVLSLDRPIQHDEQTRAREEITAALEDLRAHLQMPLALAAEDDCGDIRDKILSMGRTPEAPPVDASWSEDVSIPDELQPLVEHFIEETVTNARKHARATKIEVNVTRGNGILVDVVNDGVRRAPGTTPGCGQHLLTAEALMHGCQAEFRMVDTGRWRARLALPEEGAMA